MHRSLCFYAVAPIAASPAGAKIKVAPRSQRYSTNKIEYRYIPALRQVIFSKTQSLASPKIKLSSPSICYRFVIHLFRDSPGYFVGKSLDVSSHPDHANAESTRVTPRHYLLLMGRCTMSCAVEV